MRRCPLPIVQGKQGRRNGRRRFQDALWLINYRDTFQAMLAALLTLSVYNLIEGRNPRNRGSTS
jgi:hypothetical protein